MSDANLVVGQLSKEYQEAAAAAMTRLGIPSSADWRQSSGQPTEISLFNLATLVFFTDHVAKLEGFADSGAAMERTRFRHLPWWQTSIWLPVVFQPPTDPAINLNGWPVFLGSCHGLLADLAEVQKLSNLSLGTEPDGYNKMRADYEAFERSGFEMSDEKGLIQWVWKGLHDGAELAAAGSALLLETA